MRVVVTRPLADAERSAETLRRRGHDVLVAPLMQVEPIPADLAGTWSAVVITSANAPGTVAHEAQCEALRKLPLFAVGARSAQAARAAGFTDVATAGGDARGLVQLIAERHARAQAPLLYLAGEDRAADLIGELAAHGIKAEMRVVYRAVTAPFPSALIAALKDGAVDAVLHYSRRSADNFVAGAAAAGVAAAALNVRHICLAPAIAAPLQAAGATRVAIASHPQETALFELLTAPAS
jgi:uroporphyrinogen-III synthase